jgi:hypothetical protein
MRDGSSADRALAGRLGARGNSSVHDRADAQPPRPRPPGRRPGPQRLAGEGPCPAHASDALAGSTGRHDRRRRCDLRAAATSASSTIALPLKLVRSYAIPADDPSYKRLLNWSWTYDSAVSAAAFAASGDKSNAQRLLDQLAALQHTGGSIEIAFDTSTGQNAPVFRAGTVAWVGLAAAAYDAAFDTGRYLDTEQRAGDYLLSLQTAGGLIRGGPTSAGSRPSTT